MGYGRGNVGTGMHLVRGFHNGLRQKPKHRCQQSKVRNTDFANHPFDTSDDSESIPDMGTITSEQMFTGGNTFDCDRNLAASIIAKLSGVSVDEVRVDSIYEIKDAENCFCYGTCDDHYDWSVSTHIFYDVEDHLGACPPSTLVVCGDIDCELLINPMDDPNINSMRMSWFGPNDLLSHFKGLMQFDGGVTPQGNITVIPSQWIFDVIDWFQVYGLRSNSHSSLADNILLADSIRLDSLVNIVKDVSQSICRCIKSEGYRVYNSLPQGVKFRNLQG